jgi:hypothetical protein
MRIPEKGFYYHYKHDPEGLFNNYAYELLGTARHSEDKSLLAVYLPLYENTYAPPADYCVRPLGMFMEEVRVNGKTLPRFARITDERLIARLQQAKAELYGQVA